MILPGEPVDAVLIAGPTASGKSALAIDMARRLNGVVINADSMQIYRDLHVLTARPSAADEQAAPHRLYGVVDGAENYSVARWLAAAEQELQRARDLALTPIFVGGTGLYFRALLEGLSDIPPVPPELRAALRAEAELLAGDALHARLAARDPLMAARLEPGDRQRILRALEVVAATGRSLAAFQEQRVAGPLAAARTQRLFLAPERATLYARIDARFDQMMREGAVEEVKRLAARGLDPALPVMRAHGVPGLTAWLRGAAAREDAVTRGKADTRHYAKRQFTWFRHQMAGWTWVAV
ncbi:tRNA (adenosine(37)-N6)-dimethylallyltransferase MiaA [Camelimonas fluminis]|uniref:tRNA dimethylallyltransferase n=1 Tax=Camelimonas fluminis TaxID=1576911 RepID=A0ABV7UJ73_9HYPH|nr:tRNA (adenosine(37)-N6)-dimethylallyltransferase MiaA [Camelimonas fluminis]